MRLLIENGHAVLPDGLRPCDIAVADGKITALSAPGKRFDKADFDDVIDARGLTVLPGAIDAHVHFRTPGGEHKEDWESGSLAALAGGVTCVLDMPNTDPPTIDLLALAAKREQIAAKARVHYGLFMGATQDNLDQVAQAQNICGLKVYMGSSTGGLLVHEDGPLAEIFEKFSGTLAVHAEDELIIQENSITYKSATAPSIHPVIRNVLSARRATARAIALAKRFNRPLHICHMSTGEELELVRAARAAGLHITCEVAPHHLVLNQDALDEIGTLAKMNPPLREAHNLETLWDGIATGDVAMVATDHAPHTLREKAGSYWQAPSGVPGVQHMLPILLNRVAQGNLTMERVAQLIGSGPADLFGIQNKGRIAVGMDADLTVIDPKLTKPVNLNDVMSKCGWSPYEGMEFTGWPVMTLLDGVLAYDRGAFPNEVRGREATFTF